MSGDISLDGILTESGDDPSGAAATPAPGHAHQIHDLDIETLRHPYEASRFALALVAMAVPVAFAIFVLVSLGQATMLITIILMIGFVILLVWLSLQLWRIRLLGDAVLVSEDTLPELQSIIDTAREKLGYTRPLRVFVVDKMSTVLAMDAAPITFTQYFGIRVLIAEGSALGDLADEKDRARLLFTIATYIGALKARYARWWSPLITAFQMTRLTVVAQPFINPYYRATVFSGDRIAYAACGDLDISLDVVYRAMVGKEIASHLRAAGLTGQALEARRRKLLRFVQLLRHTPHATSRYLELMAFISQTAPEEFESHRATLGATSAQAGSVLTSLGRRRSHEGAPLVGVALATIVLLVGLGAGLTARNSPVAQAFAEAFGWPPSSDRSSDSGGESGGYVPGPSATTTEPIQTPTPTFSTSTTEPDPHVAALLARAGADPSYACSPDTVPDEGAITSVSCYSTDAGPNQIRLIDYGTGTAMRAAIPLRQGELQEGGCSDGTAGQTTWSRGRVVKGPLACYSSGGDNDIVWGSDDTGVLAVADDASWSLSQLYHWWAGTRIAVD